jgi:hypothetical protein
LAGTFSKIYLQPYPISIDAALAGRGYWDFKGKATTSEALCSLRPA